MREEQNRHNIFTLDWFGNKFWAPKTFLKNDWMKPFEQYGANLLCPPGLNLNSPQGPLPHFVINISKKDLERILKYVKKNPEGFGESILGRKLLRLALQ